MTRTTTAVARGLVVAAAVAGAVGVTRARSLRWGATDAEAAGRLPGDDVVPEVNLQATRAITIDATPADVWPWLVQMGQGRGGLYSYDALENLIGCDIHSAQTIVEEWQTLHVGDEVRLHPEGGLTVAAIEPGHALVLGGGMPVGGAAAADRPMPFAFSWAFVVRPTPDGATRLVVRERYGYLVPWAGLMVEPVEWASLVMTLGMLRGIRSRVESHARH